MLNAEPGKRINRGKLLEIEFNMVIKSGRRRGPVLLSEYTLSYLINEMTLSFELRRIRRR